MTATVARRQPTPGHAGAGLWARAVLAASTVFVLVYGGLMVARHHLFYVHAFDFGIFDQGLWLLSRFQEPFVTVRGLHLFADHSSYLMLLLVPLYWVLPAQELLIVLTVVLLAAGGPLSYALARSFGATPGLSAVVAAGFLLHPALTWAARDGFHPEYAAIPLVIAAVLLIKKNHDGWALVLIAAAILTKEDAALLLVPLGIYIAVVMGRRKTGAVIAVASAAAMALSFGVLLPHFSPTGTVLYSDRYDALGTGILGIGWGMLTRPQVVLSGLLAPTSLGYLAAIVFPIPLALLAPRALILGIPTLLANVLSEHTYQSSIKYHYTAYLIAVVAIAAATGVPKLVGRSRGVITAAVVVSLGAGLGAQVWLGPTPLAPPPSWPPADRAVMREALAMIPEDTVVSAFDSFVPHLTHRTTVYEFPNPWQPLNWGAPGVTLPDTADVEWVLVRTDIYPEQQQQIDALRHSDAFEVVFEEHPVLLLHRGG